MSQSERQHLLEMTLGSQLANDPEFKKIAPQPNILEIHEIEKFIRRAKKDWNIDLSGQEDLIIRLEDLRFEGKKEFLHGSSPASPGMDEITLLTAATTRYRATDGRSRDEPPIPAIESSHAEERALERDAQGEQWAQSRERLLESENMELRRKNQEYMDRFDNPEGNPEDQQQKTKKKKRKSKS
jgi:hypothetical protein